MKNGIGGGYKVPGHWAEVKRDAMKRIKQFYPFHIFFFLFAVPYTLKTFKSIDVFYGVLNMLLLQSWVPVERCWLGFNGVSWFLSTLMFLQIWNYPLKCMSVSIESVERYHKHRKVYLLILSACIIGVFFWAWIFKDMERYWKYTFPPARSFDYLAGYALGRVFVLHNEQPHSMRIKDQTGKEAACVAIYIFYLLIYQYVPDFLSRDALFLPGALYCIYIFACQNGAVSKMLSSSWLVWLGNHSLYYMMSHGLVMKYLWTIAKFMNLRQESMLMFWTIAALGITIISCPVFLCFLRHMNILTDKLNRKCNLELQLRSNSH